jgi:hypothetical protein
MQSMAREDTESISFRVNSDLLDKLRLEADDRRLSTNSLAIQIFSDYVGWHSGAQKAGFIAIASKLVSKLLEKSDDEEIAAMARSFAKNESKDVMLVLRNEYSMEAMLDVVETWARICGYSYRLLPKDGKDIYVIQHNMGKKWSLMIKELIRQTYEDFGRPPPEFDSSENIVSFRVDRS